MEQEVLQPKAIPHQAAVSIQDGTFSWDHMGEPALKDVNLEVLEGQLLMVVGEVGAGKSSILQALLGEMEVSHGEVHVAGD